MPRKPKQTMAEQLNAAQLAINNSLADVEIQAAVAAYGYPAAKLNEGKALYEAARNTVNARTAEAGGAKRATTGEAQTRAAAQAAYQDLTKVARAVFVKDKPKLATLGLNGKMPRTTAGFLKAAYALFDNTLDSAEIKTALAEYGYDEARLKTERAKIAAYDAANQAQGAAGGTAQQATRDQQTALNTLNDWVSQYRAIAKVALRGKKQLLEKLGLTVRSAKTAAQRAAPRKAAETRKKMKALLS